MRQEVITRDLYTFNELSDSSKQHALEELWDLNVDYDWWEFTYDDAAHVGIKITGFDLDRGRDIDGGLTEAAIDVAENILREHGGMCETYKTAKAFLDLIIPVKARHEKAERIAEDYGHHKLSGRVYDLQVELENQIEELEDEFTRDILADYLQILDREYDYLTSEEAIIESIEANKYEFTEEGDLA